MSSSPYHQPATSKYERRLGFYLLIVGIVWSLYNLVQGFRLNPELEIRELLDRSPFLSKLFADLDSDSKLSLAPALARKLNYIISNWIGMVASAAFTLVYVTLLVKPKLTTEKGHFVKVFLALLGVNMVSAVAAFFSHYDNSEVFSQLAQQMIKIADGMNPNDQHTLQLRGAAMAWSYTPSKIALYTIAAILFGLIWSLIGAAGLTMDEEYQDRCSCLKCLKPYRTIEVLPTKN